MLKNQLYVYLKDRIEYLLNQVFTNGYRSMSTININFGNGKVINFNSNDLEKIIKQFSLALSVNDISFLKLIQNQIKNDSFEYGIDINNFSFDINTINKIRTNKWK